MAIGHFEAAESYHRRRRMLLASRARRKVSHQPQMPRQYDDYVPDAVGFTMPMTMRQR